MDKEKLKREIREGAEDFIKQLRTLIVLAEIETAGMGVALIEVINEELDKISQNLTKA